MGFNTVKAALALNPKPAFGLSSAANPVPLPQPKPRAMREHFVMPSISGRQVTCAEWPKITGPNLVEPHFSVSALIIKQFGRLCRPTGPCPFRSTLRVQQAAGRVGAFLANL